MITIRTRLTKPGPGRRGSRTFALPLPLALILVGATAVPAPGVPPAVETDGTVHISGLSVPLSRYMSEEAKQQFIEQARRRVHKILDPHLSISEKREVVDAYLQPFVDRAKAIYPVEISERRIAGVNTQVVIPKAGVSLANKDRVLINLHGGGFTVGAGIGGLSESVPIAGLGKFKVITIDYRQAPEYKFPAASEDVAAVYAELLKNYKPENIGIYGCSAGGVLSAMSAAWLQMKKLPQPGALGMIHAGAYANFNKSPALPNSWGGDSRYLVPPLLGLPSLSVDERPTSTAETTLDYTASTDERDPLASPALSPEILAKFPPTLLLTATRAHDMSAAVQTHRLLTNAGVAAELHVWDGLGHCFFVNPDLPESQEAYLIIAKFFDKHLGHIK